MFGTHVNCIQDVLEMSTHDRGYYGEKRAMFSWIILLTRYIDIFSMDK